MPSPYAGVPAVAGPGVQADALPRPLARLPEEDREADEWRPGRLRNEELRANMEREALWAGVAIRTRLHDQIRWRVALDNRRGHPGPWADESKPLNIFSSRRRVLDTRPETEASELHTAVWTNPLNYPGIEVSA